MDKRSIEERLERVKSEAREICIFGAGNVGKNNGLALLRKRGIDPDYYCDSNSEIWEKEVKDGIKCISINELIKRNPICFIMVAVHLMDEVYKVVSELGITDIIRYDDLLELERDRYFEFQRKKQIAVYTCIVGDYDNLMEPISVSEECDYYLISDKKPNTGSVFKYIDIADCKAESICDLTKKNRYCKIKAHEFFPQYRYSIYFDGNDRITSKIINKIHELPKTRIIARADNFFDCLYMEAIRAGEHFRDKKEIIANQVEKYWNEGMPEHFGSFICGILIREHNNPICVRLMNDWWDEVEKYSKKDQIAFPYVLWKNGYTKEDVGTVVNRQKENVFNNEYFVWDINHKKPRL